MFAEGNIKCVEKLLIPAKRVIEQGELIAHEPYDRKIGMWNEIMEHYDRFQDGECGTFFEKDITSHVHSQFNAGLLILAYCFQKNNEVFPPAGRFSNREIEIYQKICQYDVFEILSPSDLERRMHSNPDLLSLLVQYQEMGGWVDTSLEDTKVNKWVRLYLKKKWDHYKQIINRALSSEIIRKIIDEAQKKVNDKSKEAFERERDLDKAREMIDTKERDLLQLKNEDKRKAELIDYYRKQSDARKEPSSRYVSLGDVKQFELNFIGRTELKLGKVGTVHPLFNGLYKVQEITEGKDVKVSDVIKSIHRPLSSTEIGNLPENRYLITDLIEKKVLFRKDQYLFWAVFHARTKQYAEMGFDTAPLSVQEINPILSDARDEAKRLGRPIFLCIASPTGFEPALRSYIDGEHYYKNFRSQHLSTSFLDLETAQLITNPHDRLAQELSKFCTMEIDREVYAKAKKIISKSIDEELAIKSFCEYYSMVKRCRDEGIKDEMPIKAAFYEVAKEKKIIVGYVEKVGLVGMRE